LEETKFEDYHFKNIPESNFMIRIMDEATFGKDTPKVMFNSVYWSYSTNQPTDLENLMCKRGLVLLVKWNFGTDHSSS